MNIFEEEKYYASMVRKYKSEDHQQSLQEFCKKEHLSYTKMLNTLRLSEQQWQQRQDSYRRREINRQTQPRHEESGFKPLIIDAPQEQDTREPEKALKDLSV